MYQTLQGIRFFAITWLGFVLIIELYKETKLLEQYFPNSIRGLESHKIGGSYTNPEVLEKGCSVTVLLSDPRLSTVMAESKVWYSLDSMAINLVPIETTCVIIMTSLDCKHSTNRINPGNSLTQSSISKEDVYDKFSQYAHPHFRSLIDRGNVRVSFPDMSRYPTDRCEWNVNRMYMHPAFWDVEFTAQDSDSVLVMQADSVFCHTFDIRRWNDLAFVGSVWSKACGLCNAIRGYWQQWNPDHQDLADICSNGHAPSGNGGFSLRSRNWLKKAIHACPSKFVTTPRTECFVSTDIAEDVYFATALLGLQAPLPTSIEAALFAAETQFLEGVLEDYPASLNMDIVTAVQRRWGNLTKYNKMRQHGGFIIPIGMHKPWPYHSFDILLHDQMKIECPYFEKISHADWLHQGKLYFNRRKHEGNRMLNGNNV